MRNDWTEEKEKKERQTGDFRTRLRQIGLGDRGTVGLGLGRGGGWGRGGTGEKRKRELASSSEAKRRRRSTVKCNLAHLAHWGGPSPGHSWKGEVGGASLRRRDSRWLSSYSQPHSNQRPLACCRIPQPIVPCSQQLSAPLAISDKGLLGRVKLAGKNGRAAIFHSQKKQL